MTPAGLARVEPWLRDWLAEPRLLTRRMRDTFGAGFALSVERQAPARLSLDEAALLGCPVQAALAREIELRADGEPCVFARTLVPQSTLEVCAWLGDLGDSPLGEALRGRPGVSRSGFELARLTARDTLFDAAARHLAGRPDALWARRSVFLLGAAGLVVCEVFLPALGRVPRAAGAAG